MRNGIKIKAIAVVLIIGGASIILIGGATGKPGGGIPGLVIGFAMLAGFKAIWKYKGNDDEEDKHTLSKS
jgi:hypothetical protein